MACLKRGAVAAAVALLVGAEATPVEVVVSHFDEDLAWLSKLKSEAGEKPKISVYTKGEGEVKDAGLDTQHLPNVGREAHTYLNHIVNNYDKLADWTVFTQAGEPSFGYKGHHLGGGHLLSGDNFVNYLTPSPSGARFVHTASVHLPSMHHSLRNAFCINDTRIESGAVAACPADASKWTQWWALGELKHFIDKKVQAQGGEQPLNFYRKYINPSHNGCEIALSFPQGARFAVSRDKILSKPKEVYERLLAELSKDADPYAGYFMEWMWSELFLGHQACDLPRHKAAVSHEQAMQELGRRYFSKSKHLRFLSASVSGAVSGGSTTTAAAPAEDAASRQQVMTAVAVTLAAAMLS